jgi:hypothetical protein
VVAKFFVEADFGRVHVFSWRLPKKQNTFPQIKGFLLTGFGWCSAWVPLSSRAPPLIIVVTLKLSLLPAMLSSNPATSKQSNSNKQSTRGKQTIAIA